MKMLFSFCLSITAFIDAFSIQPDSSTTVLPYQLEAKIDSFIVHNMQKEDYPGMAVAIVRNNKTIFLKGYGYANLEQQQKVTPSTLFEIGSNSKAFTGVALIELEKSGHIRLTDPVKKYIPWFKSTYKGIEYEITLQQLLHHSSGISYMAIKDIAPGWQENALEDAVKNIMKHPLMFEPGSKFGYSTSNYDVIGYIIELVTKQSFEDYLEEVLLEPLELKNTHAKRDVYIDNPNMATGYKLSLFGNKPLLPPPFRGNLPAGYIVSNITDIAHWLTINLQSHNTNGDYWESIHYALLPDTSVESTLVFPYAKPFSYGGGWLVFDEENRISHGGGNPNFASYISLYPEENLGIAVLGNRNSNAPYGICNGLYQMLNNSEPSKVPTDILLISNKILIILMGLGILLTMLSLIGFIRLSYYIKTRIRLYKPRKKLMRSIILVTGTLVTGAFLYYLPIAIYFGFPWSLISLWAPFTIKPALLILFVGITTQYILSYTKKMFPIQQH